MHQALAVILMCFFVPKERQALKRAHPKADACCVGTEACTTGCYFSQPRLRKYHMGPSALATISASA